MLDKNAIAQDFKAIQADIVNKLTALDGGALFETEKWERPGGGGGESKVLQNGALIEKGGVNFSAVYGKLPDAVKKAFKTDQEEFFATGVSIVLHPHNPWVPIIHMNIRYFEMQGTGNETLRWFGGGIDVTPHYVIKDAAKNFHVYLKSVCDSFDASLYPKYKTWADDYFYIKHRKETRGIGGIFYDRLTPQNTPLTWEQLFDFSKAVGNSFVPIYTNLVANTREKHFSLEEKQWQLQRRSRYAEFNLVYDSGTKFGLETDGRIESILMSMPPMAAWVYDYKALPDTPEAETMALLQKGIDWTAGEMI
ncbi:coproporphyrinogen III oxidase [Pelobium manganitolerans]|uniref:coproporphyrinogen oxidase n=1 Tax=Pelobium manganitolerans TaxID=1842495 RepID=A0A419S7M4_9SPHI|nr:oxygen-dependent coproporphyrinogen oxidase [Pelobium manganitolerans]RKD17502.1 coproporphyrinogen III oxidase [Pelobium manganitolerans]